ncbi:hypothetical protein KUTeg_017734 [Tegillarca granosa]|uniref:DNA polymerase kappa n=1 Tax=Tegillarca granosa TaxID=220873 RepID=A0ABQ9EJU4_TEGGR|nr:hypothetical protein KUTeg_017734 [Tegillarca granosa]
MNSEDLSDHSDEEDWMDTNWLNEEMSSVSTESSKTLKSPNNCSGTQHIQGLFPPAKNNEDACTTKLEKKMDDSLMSRSKFYENERKKEEQADMLLEEFERARDLSRTIVHIDMDAFYAAVEIRDKPSLKDKPMAVGSSSMLSTSNYHARKYGVRAAMPGFIGKKLCPDLIIVPQNFEKYTSVSKQVKNILAEYDPNFCPMSLDEAYLDITDHLQKRQMMSEEDRSYLCRKCDNLDTKQCLCDLNEVIKQPMCMKKSSNLLQEGKKKGLDEYRSDQEADEKSLKCLENTKICPVCGKPFPDYEAVVFGSSPDDTVHEMRSRIEQKTRLTASAGIAPNMMLSKISGIGKVTEQMLNAVGVVTCTDLYNKRALLYHLYSQISFNYFMRICLGIGSTTVERDSERKSISTERTFSEISNPSDLYSKCNELCEALSNDLEEEQLKGKTVTIKLKTVKFEVKTRAHTLPEYTSDVEVIFATAKDLLKTEIQHVSPNPLRLRLMGVRMSSLLHQSLCKSKQKQRTLSGIVKKMVNKSTSNRTLTGIGMIQDTQTAEKITQNEFTNGETLTGLDNFEQNDCIKFSDSRVTRMCSNKSDSETYTEKMSCSSTSTTSIMAKELNKRKSCDNNREENIASQNPLLMTANGHEISNEISNMEVCRNIDTIIPGFQKGSDFQDSLDTSSTLESVPYFHSDGETVHSVLAGPKNKGAKDAEIGMNYDDTLAKFENENLECARKPIDSSLQCGQRKN